MRASAGLTGALRAAQDICYLEPGELLAGLRAIRDDPAVRLLRVRSGLLHRAAGGVGPGEVAVTLQVATEGTRRLGLDDHAAEVRARPRSPTPCRPPLVAKAHCGQRPCRQRVASADSPARVIERSLGFQLQC